MSLLTTTIHVLFQTGAKGGGGGGGLGGHDPLDFPKIPFTTIFDKNIKKICINLSNGPIDLTLFLFSKMTLIPYITH